MIDRHATRSRAVVALCAAATIVLGAACTTQAQPTPEPTVPSFESTTGSAAPTTTAGPRLAQECSGLVSVQTIDLALGAPIVGRTRSVVGVPEPGINRLERLTCQYGLPEPPPPPGTPVVPPLEISVSVYGDEASAQERIGATIEGERGRGAAPSTVQLGPADGTLLVTNDSRLLVAVDGPVTLAITVAPGVVDDRIADFMADLGGQILESLQG